MEELGDYKLIRQLGKGSLGTLYVAEHLFLKKNVAIKILPQDFSQEEGFFERFVEGVQNLSHLDHPSIVKMQTVSSYQGRYFLVSDYICNEQGQAQNLSQFIEAKGPLNAEAAYALLSKLGEAIDYAREKNVIHGFLKPSNILIGSENQIFVSDLGLAKILGEELLMKKAFKNMSESIVFRSRDFLDHFCYLSPEQKKYQKTDFSSDVFAFGQICHFVLTGHPSEGVLEVEHGGWKALLQQALSYRQEMRKMALSSLMQEVFKEAPLSLRVVEDQEREVPKVTEVDGLTASHKDHSVAMLLKKDPIVTEYHPEKNASKDAEPLETKMVLIPKGSYFRGTDKGNRDESPRHKVNINAFYLDIHPVTNEQFIRFLEYMGGEKDQNYHDLIRLKDSRINRSAGKLSIESGYAKHPVVGVTWYGAFSYAEWLGKRLPTEAEWEIAATGGDEKIIYPTGDTIEKKDANFFSSDTTQVLSYSPNGYGLFDMAGNVYEWCQDWYGYNYYESSALEPNNPKGPHQGVYRVLRGGCWKSLKDDLRISHRHRNNPGTVNGTYGFRCASDA